MSWQWSLNFGGCQSQSGVAVKIHRPRPCPASVAHQTLRTTALTPGALDQNTDGSAYSGLSIQREMHVEGQGRFYH